MSNLHTRNRPDEGAVLWKAVARIADLYQLGRKDLEDILGFSQPTLSRLYAKDGTIDPYSKKGEIALLLVRLYKSLSANTGGDDESARQWLNSNNRYFNEAPLDHMRKITGMMEVVIYLDAMRGKL